MLEIIQEIIFNIQNVLQLNKEQWIKYRLIPVKVSILVSGVNTEKSKATNALIYFINKFTNLIEERCMCKVYVEKFNNNDSVASIFNFDLNKSLTTLLHLYNVSVSPDDVILINIEIL